MSSDIKGIADTENESSVLFNEPLGAHTTFGTGGPADIFVTAKSPMDLGLLLDVLKFKNMPYFIIGRGSNVLASDDGFRGTVVKPAYDSISIDDDIITASAGAKLSAVCAFATQHSLSGLEFACGIPGTVGGAVMMNAGAYGGEISDVLISAIVFDSEKGFSKIGAIGMGLSYRHCARLASGSVLYQAKFKLTPGDKAEILSKTEQLLNRRRASQPLDYPSAGSTFKRPQGHYAGKLIEDCGLKGCSIGGAAVSEKHAGFIINTGGATSADIYRLIKHVIRVVLEKTGVTLEPEVRFLGDFSN